LIKGLNKRVIVIKNPQSEIFEEAHFFVKSGKSFFGAPRENDMVTEANKILEKIHAQNKSSGKGGGVVSKKKPAAAGLSATGEFGLPEFSPSVFH